MCVSKETLVCVEQNGSVSQLHSQNLRPLQTNEIYLLQEEQHRFSKSAAIAYNATSVFINEQTKKAVFTNPNNTLGRKAIELNHKGNVEVCKLSKDSMLFACGGSDGRTHLYQAPSYQLLGVTQPRPDYISAIAFSDCGKFMAIGGYDGLIIIHHSDTLDIITTITLNSPIEDITFTSNNCVVAVAREGKMVHYEMRSNIRTVIKLTLDAWATRLCLSEDERFTLVGTRDNQLYILNTDTLDYIFTVSTTHSGVCSMLTYNSFIYLGYSDGHIGRIGALHEINTINALLEQKNFKKASDFIISRPWSITYSSTIAFDSAWPISLERSLNQLQKGFTKSAEMLVRPFLFDPTKRQTFDQMFKNGKLLHTFNTLVEEKKYIDAFIYADKSSIVKFCSAYKKLESYWNKLIKYVLSLVAEDANFYKSKIETILKPYQQIRSKNQFVTNLIVNAATIEEANKAVKEKDYQHLFTLVQKHHFLKASGLFKQVALRTELLFEKVSQFLKLGDYDSALEILAYLKHNPELQDKVSEQIELIRKQIRIAHHLDNEELLQAANLLKLHPKLASTKEYHDTMYLFNEKVCEALVYAKKGLPSKAKTLLANFYDAGLFKGRIITVYELAYLEELKIAYSENPTGYNWKESVQHFYILFGSSIEIDKLAKVLKLSNLKINQVSFAPFPKTVLIRKS
jgi:hypothetical protein